MRTEVGAGLTPDLSAGMVKRIALVRTLIGDAPLIALQNPEVDLDQRRGSQLSPLATLAEDLNIAVSAITHPSKNMSNRKAIDQFIGSQAFIAAARIGHLCVEEMIEGEEGEEPVPTGNILFAQVKNNPDELKPTLAYAKQCVEVALDALELMYEGDTSRT